MDSDLKYLLERELLSVIENNSSLSLPIDQDEVEIRFGKKISGIFDTNIGIDKFKKVFNTFKNYDNSKKYIILDWIYRKDLLMTLPTKYQKLVRRQTVESNLDMFDEIDFNKYDSRKMEIMRQDIKKELEMRREVKIRDLTDLSPTELKEQADIEKIRKEYFVKGDTILLSKTHVIKNKTTNNLRLTHVKENIFNFQDHSVQAGRKLLTRNIPYSAVRIKHRFATYYENVWRIDLTIVRLGELKWIRGLKKEKAKEYQVEIEFDLENYLLMTNKPSIDDILNSLDKLTKLIFEIFGDNKPEETSPHTLERKDLTTISSIPYSVTDKADGERMFLYINNDISYLMNPKTEAIKLEIEMKVDDSIDLKNTIIDGEYLEKTKSFYAFDMLYDNGTDIRKNDLKMRLNSLDKLLKSLKKSFKDINISIKTFYFENIFVKAKEIWLNKDKFPYELDGLIFTPINEPYNHSKNTPIFKWKEKHSIDVRVEPTKRFTYFHNKSIRGNTWDESRDRRIKKLQNDIYDKIKESNFTNYNFDIKHARFVINDIKGANFIENRLVTKLQIRGGEYKNYLGVPGSVTKMLETGEEIVPKSDIIEFEFNRSRKMWEPLRKRTFDKEAPNAARTIESALTAIYENITIDELSLLKLNDNNRIRDVGQQYDDTKDKTHKRDPWRNFHNYIKSTLITNSGCSLKSKRKFLLDLGTGKGGDIGKWIEAGYTDILGIDPSVIEGQEFIKRLKGQGFVSNKDGYILRKNKKTRQNYDPAINITHISGDGSKNLRTGEAGLTNKDSQKLINFFENKDFDGFDTITIMFAIHYMFMNNSMKKDKSKFEGFIKNVTENLKPNGSFIGTYLDGHKINKRVGDSNTYSFMEKNKKIYGVDLHGDVNDSKFRKSDNFWKEDLRIMDIYNIVWGEKTIAEPQIYPKILNMLFREKKLFSIVENISFEQLYKSYLDSNFMKYKGKLLTDIQKQLPNGEKELAFINNIFYYKFKTSKCYKSLNHICNTIDNLHDLDYLNNLLKELSIDKKVDNQKDFYKELSKFVNNRENKPSKDDLLKIATYFDIKNTKQRIKDYIKVMK